MQKKSRAVLTAMLSLCLILLSARARAECQDPLATCQGIAFCINKLDQGNASTSAEIAKSIDNNDPGDTAVDIAECQHRFGAGSWDYISGGCTDSDYDALGKKARSGRPEDCSK
jgi:hypothetical protein